MRSRFLLLVPGLLLACSSTSFDTGSLPDDTGADVTHEISVDSDRDTPVDDTGAGADTGSDTGSDSGSDSGTDAPVCPAPPSTGTFDASTLTCAQLQSEYPAAVEAAKTCGCAADCSVTMCETICCNCNTYVSPSSAGYPKAKAIFTEWKARLADGRCTPPICPLFVCAGISLGGCTSSSGGAATTCLTKKGP